jgi:MoaA/NifB/PqqE/SkfB family radical SAM enzyme
MDLASFGAPVLLFSGGEPLLGRTLFEVAKTCPQVTVYALYSPQMAH